MVLESIDYNIQLMLETELKMNRILDTVSVQRKRHVITINI